jgi:hypothetical protein
MKTGQRLLLLSTVGWVGLLGAWSHQRFSRQGAHPDAAELYDAVSRTLPKNLAGTQWLRVSGQSTLPAGSGECGVKRTKVQALDEGLLRDYPELLRAEHVEFGPLRYGDQEAEVEVFFALSGGRMAPCTFRFRFENRGWKVQGIRFGRPDAEPIGGIRL